MSVNTHDQDVRTMLRETIRFKKKAQITIPKAIVEELGLHEDDLLEVRVEEGKIVLVPAVAVPKDQAWYWTEEWQVEEREVDEQISRKEISRPMQLDEALSTLDRLMHKDEQ